MQGDEQHPKTILANNYRPPQPLYNRSVRTNVFNHKVDVSIYFIDKCNLISIKCKYFGKIYRYQNYEIRCIENHHTTEIQYKFNSFLKIHLNI